MLNKYLSVFLLVFSWGWSQETIPDKTPQLRTELVFKLSPNPLTKQPLYIESNRTEVKHIRVYNALGHLVYQEKTSSNTIQLSHLPKGIYILNLEQGPYRRSRRLIVP